jgi:hypothetical protein
MNPNIKDGLITWDDGAESWYQNGQRHNLDGPAIIYPNGDKRYFIDGKEYSLDDYKLILFTLYKKYYNP